MTTGWQEGAADLLLKAERAPARQRVATGPQQSANDGVAIIGDMGVVRHSDALDAPAGVAPGVVPDDLRRRIGSLTRTLHDALCGLGYPRKQTDATMAQDVHDLASHCRTLVALVQNTEHQLVQLLMETSPPDLRKRLGAESVAGSAVKPEAQEEALKGRARVDDLLVSLGF